MKVLRSLVRAIVGASVGFLLGRGMSYAIYFVSLLPLLLGLDGGAGQTVPFYWFLLSIPAGIALASSLFAVGNGLLLVF